MWDEMITGEITLVGAAQIEQLKGFTTSPPLREVDSLKTIASKEVDFLKQVFCPSFIGELTVFV